MLAEEGNNGSRRGNGRFQGTLSNSILVFVAGSSYGFIVPVIKLAVDNGVYPADFLPMQYLFAFALCLVAMLVTRTAFGKPGRFLPMVVLGLFTGSTSICYYSSVSLLPSAVALTMLFQYVWVGIAIECIAKKRLPSRSSVLSAAIVLVGTLFAAGIFDGTFGDLDPAGIAFGAASAVFYALFLYFSGVIGADESVLLRTTMLTFGGLLITSVANPGVYVGAIFDGPTWPYAIEMSFLGILVPTALINFASPKLSSGMVAIMASSELPVGILAAWAFIGDEPTPLVMFGACLVLTGILTKQAPELYRRMSKSGKV